MSQLDNPVCGLTTGDEKRFSMRRIRSFCDFTKNILIENSML